MKIFFFKILFSILLISTLIVRCNSDDTNEPETFLCCTDVNPFENLNVDTIDINSNEFIIPDVFTPNGDGFNDEFNFFGFEIGSINYPNYLVTIYDLNNNIVFEHQHTITSENIFFDGIDINTNEELPFGSYKYKVVIENEQTFVHYGYVCVVRRNSEINGFDFSNCLSPDGTMGEDPVLNN